MRLHAYCQYRIIRKSKCWQRYRRRLLTYHDLKDKEQWDNMNTLKVSFDEYQFQTDYPEMKRLTNDFGNIMEVKT